MKVFISAYCRKPELWPMTTLVFKTLRVGFPTAKVEVALNGDHTNEAMADLLCWVAHVEGRLTLAPDKSYGERIEELILTEAQPFVIADTDLVFYENMETAPWTGPLHGCLVPEFRCPFSNARTAERLHTHLLYIDAPAIRKLLAASYKGPHHHRLVPPLHPVMPALIPDKHRGPVFYDILAPLYHMIGGQAFTDEIRDRYCHANCGTISDLVGPALGFDLTAAHKTIVEIPSFGRGLWRRQDEWYKQHAV